MTLRYVDLGFLAYCAKFIPICAFSSMQLRNLTQTPNQTTICIDQPGKGMRSPSAA